MIFTKASCGVDGQTRRGQIYLFLGGGDEADVLVTHKRATEVCGRVVPAGATGSVLAHVDVIHQAVTVQETFP